MCQDVTSRPPAFISIPILGSPVGSSGIFDTKKICIFYSHIGQLFKLPTADSLTVLNDASLQTSLTVPDVVDTEKWVTSSPTIILL